MWMNAKIKSSLCKGRSLFLFCNKPFQCFNILVSLCRSCLMQCEPENLEYRHFRLSPTGRVGGALPMRVIAQILGCRSLDKYTMLPPHKYRPTVPQIPWQLYHSLSFSCGYDFIYTGRCKMWIAAGARSPNTFDVILREGAINKAVKGSQTKRAGGF